MDMILKLLLLLILVGICDYPFFKYYLKEEDKRQGDISLKMILLMFLMLFFMPLFWGFFILR